MKKILLSATFFFTIQFAFADALTLLNGQVFDGRVQKIKDCTVVFKCEDEKYYIPADSIFSLEFSDVTDPIYTEYLSLADNNACLKGTQDAKNFHGKVGGHVLLGFLFGPFAVIGAALASPNPYKGKNTVMLSENRGSFSDPVYLKCYKKKAKARNTAHAALGWGIWLLVLVAAGS